MAENSLKAAYSPFQQNSGPTMHFRNATVSKCSILTEQDASPWPLKLFLDMQGEYSTDLISALKKAFKILLREAYQIGTVGQQKKGSQYRLFSLQGLRY